MKIIIMQATKYIAPVCLLAVLILGCARELDELDPAMFPRNPNVFINGFSAGLEYSAFGGSVPTAFDVDTRVTYANTSEASMRFDVPNAGDPRGAYAGGAFTSSTGRDLSEFDALTFWAKATKSVAVDVVGFGNDLGESKFQTSISGLQLSTAWQKYIIPIPDPSKLKSERGMFFYSAGPVEGRGYTFWIDEMKFEKLGTLAHPKFSIMNGEQITESTFIGVNSVVTGLTASINLPTGINQALNIAPAYFVFNSNNPGIATVNERGMVSVVGGPGNTTITATVGGVPANGSLVLQSTGQFQQAPVPAKDPADVISIFSNAFPNVPVNYYNGFWEPFQTTLSADFTIDGNNILNYTNFNFVGIEFSSPTVNATSMTHLHVNIFIPTALEADARFQIELVDFGGGGSGAFVSTIRADQARQWVTLDIPLANFAGLSSRANLAQVIFENTSGNIPGFYADNILFYRSPVAVPVPAVAAPTPPGRNAADVISLFSGAYNNVPVDTWRTDWSSATYEEVAIQGNPTKKYSALDFVGIETVANQLNISEMTHFHMDVWSPDFTFFGVKIVDFGPNGEFGGGDDVEHQVDFPTPANGQWVSLDIPLSQFEGLTTRNNIAQFILVGQPTGATTVYVDNMYFYRAGAGTPPSSPPTAAPTPTHAAADVISMFSNAYTNVPVDTWRTDWSSAVLEDVTIQGNATKKYSQLDFVGIETVANQINASAMTHLRMDVWSADFTFFAIKLVDFGPDGEFGGDDDVEHQVDIMTPAKGQWVSLDIPLSEFTGLTRRINLAQMILVGQPTGATTVFVDNVYFRK
jgi:hypothetical protein